MEFFTKYRRPERAPEINNGEDLVEVGSFRPMSKVIESMIVAGQRLEASVGGYEFDAEEVVDEVYFDPTREPGYDLADASRDLDIVQQRLRAAQEAAKSSPASPLSQPSAKEASGQGEPSTTEPAAAGN